MIDGIFCNTVRHAMLAMRKRPGYVGLYQQTVGTDFMPAKDFKARYRSFEYKHRPPKRSDVPRSVPKPLTGGLVAFVSAGPMPNG